jgi:Peptidase family M28/PA domain
MKHPFAGVLATLAFMGVVARAADLLGNAPAAQQPGLLRIRSEDLRANVYFLASDALQGRMSLQPGDEAAVRWLAAEFAKAGLEPVAEDPAGHASYAQTVPLIEFRPNRDADSLSLQRSGQVLHWQMPDAIGSFYDDIEVSGPLVFAGFGITAPGLGYDDYRGLDVKDKIVLIFDHEPQETDRHSSFNGTGNTRYATARVKALNAQAHGARGVLIAGEPNRRHPFLLDLHERMGGNQVRVMPLPSQSIVDDELRVPVVYVSDALCEALLSNAHATPQALQAGIDKDLSSHSQAIPDSVATLHLENKSRMLGVTQNVAGLLRGTDSSLAAETVIISAHHDHDGVALNGSGYLDVFHGADDNASGTAGVVELAYAFAANPVKPKRSILFVVFGAEERGLLGAYYMTAHPLRPLATTRALINFDMIGRDEAPSEHTDGLMQIPGGAANRLNLIGGTYSPELRRTVMQANREVGLDLDDRFDHDHALNTLFRSDQFPFVLQDIPALWFLTGFHPDYHRATDTADKINYPKMLKILQLAYLSTWILADQADFPKFIPDPAGN